MITPRPSPDNSTPKPGFPMRPFFGIDPVLVDDKVCMLRDLWHILILLYDELLSLICCQ